MNQKNICELYFKVFIKKLYDYRIKYIYYKRKLIECYLIFPLFYMIILPVIYFLYFYKIHILAILGFIISMGILGYLLYRYMWKKLTRIKKILKWKERHLEFTFQKVIKSFPPDADEKFMFRLNRNINHNIRRGRNKTSLLNKSYFKRLTFHFHNI